VLASAMLLVNAVIDPSSRVPTLAVFGIIIIGIPLYYLTVGRGRVARLAEGGYVDPTPKLAAGVWIGTLFLIVIVGLALMLRRVF